MEREASTSWQLAAGAARRYEDILVPTILGPAARAVADSAKTRPGVRVVDLGCGTGIASRYAASTPNAPAQILGLDISGAMIAMARERARSLDLRIEYGLGDMVALPLANRSIDVVLCAQTLQFVRDYPAASREMWRVLRPGGLAVIGLWCPARENPYFEALIRAMESHIGSGTAAGLKAIFNLSDARTTEQILKTAGLEEVKCDAVDLDVKLPNLNVFVPRHIGATPMAAGYAAAPTASRSAVVTEVRDTLAGLASGDGGIPFRTYVFSARKAT
jgi:ubiquinone/menaquinone biosynthesis C-methylase UbiE